MYFLLGNVLEYIKNVELKIIIPIIVIFGIIKITVRINIIDYVLGRNLRYLRNSRSRHACSRQHAVSALHRHIKTGNISDLYHGDRQMVLKVISKHNNRAVVHK
jgi:hypothetical protein